MSLTAVYVKVPEGYAAFVEELPGANSQGETIEEARANLVGSGWFGESIRHLDGKAVSPSTKALRGRDKVALTICRKTAPSGSSAAGPKP